MRDLIFKIDITFRFKAKSCVKPFKVMLGRNNDHLALKGAERLMDAVFHQ